MISFLGLLLICIFRIEVTEAASLNKKDAGIKLQTQSFHSGDELMPEVWKELIEILDKVEDEEEHSIKENSRENLYFPKYEEYLRAVNTVDSNAIYVENLQNYQPFLINLYDKKASARLSSVCAAKDIHVYSKLERKPRNYGNSADYSLYKPLVHDNNTVSYNVLSNCPHGRHLLLVTLLEDLDTEYWAPRCNSYVKYYLPPSLRSPSQGDPPADACVLREISLKGKKLKREDILNIFRHLTASTLPRRASFSRFNRNHVRAVNSLVKFALDQETFDSMISLLVVLRDVCNKGVFINAIYEIIQAREEVGFVLPSLISVIPEDFVPSFTLPTDEESGQRRAKRADDWGSWRSLQNRVFSYRTTHRTYPVGEKEGELWHIREDPMVNSMHGTWHNIMNANSGFTMPRRGEIFYHMHKQMICRYNADRLAAGLDLVAPYDEPAWDRPGLIGYNPRLREVRTEGSEFSERPANSILKDTSDMKTWASQLRAAIGNMRISSRRLEYSGGEDKGISRVMDAVESYGGWNTYGDLHNAGHIRIATMTNGSGSGVMGTLSTSMRDPVFYRWHKFIDSFAVDYKNRLGRYGDEELSFPGVSVSQFTILSGGRQNSLRTYVETVSLQLDDRLLSMQTGNVNTFQYERVNNDEFSYTISIKSTFAGGAVGRVYLIPNSYANSNVEEVAILMDLFYMDLVVGENSKTRRRDESPMLTRGSPLLRNLQGKLLSASMSETQFNNANCGWPMELAIPKGTKNGMEFLMVMMVNRLLPSDSARINDWNGMNRVSWGWCGVRQGDSTYPDSRPMGFPLDRQMTLKELTTGRLNYKVTLVTIHHSSS